MEKKREQIETQNIQTLLQDFLSQEKIKQNLQSLHEEVKAIFQSRQSKSRLQSPPQHPRELLPEGENQEEEPVDSKEFSLLYQEYKNFIKEKSPEKGSKMQQPPKDSRTESQQKENIITVNNSEKKSANVVERYEGIKERFDSLAKRFEKYIEHKGEEEPPIKKGENFLENIEEEKDHLKSSDLLDSNKQESLMPPHTEQDPEEQHEQHVNTQPYQNEETVEQGEEDLNEELNEEVWGENYQILVNIAILIQKVWRGYRTRKILSEYFEIILNGDYLENIEGGHGEGPGNEIIMEDELEDQMESMHKENQLKKKSRSADLQHESPGEKTEHDEYKLQEEFINSKGNKILSHNVLYNRPDSRGSEDEDKIMHISDIMEDEGLSKSQDKSKEIKPSSKKQQPQPIEPKRPFAEEALFKKLNNANNANVPQKNPVNTSNNNPRMPVVEIIASTDEFHAAGLPPQLDKSNLHTDKTVEQSISRRDVFQQPPPEENSLEYTRPSHKSGRPRYSDSDKDSLGGSHGIQGGFQDSSQSGLAYKKRNRLMLDVDEIEREHQVHEKLVSDLSNKNSDNIAELRKTLCSEKLLREQATRSQLTQFKPLKLKSGADSLEEPQGLRDSRDSKRGLEENLSIFEQEPFKDFTFKLFQDLVHNDVRKSSDGLVRESGERGVERKEKETPKNGAQARKGLIEKWVNPEESLSSKGVAEVNNKWNSPFYGFKKVLYIGGFV